MNPVMLSGSFIKRFALSGLIALSMLSGVYTPVVGAAAAAPVSTIAQDLLLWFTSAATQEIIKKNKGMIPSDIWVNYFQSKFPTLAGSASLLWAAKGGKIISQDLLGLMDAATAVVPAVQQIASVRGQGIAAAGKNLALALWRPASAAAYLGGVAQKLPAATVITATAANSMATIADSANPVKAAAVDLFHELSDPAKAYLSSLWSKSPSAYTSGGLLGLASVYCAWEAYNYDFIKRCAKKLAPRSYDETSVTTWLYTAIQSIQDEAIVFDRGDGEVDRVKLIVRDLHMKLKSKQISLLNAAGIPVEWNEKNSTVKDLLNTIDRELVNIKAVITAMNAYNYDISMQGYYKRGWKADVNKAGEDADIAWTTPWYMLSADKAKKRDQLFKNSGKAVTSKILRILVPASLMLSQKYLKPTISVRMMQLLLMSYYLQPTKLICSKGKLLTNKAAKKLWYDYMMLQEDMNALRKIVDTYWNEVIGVSNSDEEDKKGGAAIAVPSAAAVSSSSTSSEWSASSSSPASSSSQSAPRQASSSSSFSSLTSGSSSSSASAVDDALIDLNGANFCTIHSLNRQNSNHEREIQSIMGKFGPKEAGFNTVIMEPLLKQHLPGREFSAGIRSDRQPANSLVIAFKSLYAGRFDENCRPVNLKKVG